MSIFWSKVDFVKISTVFSDICFFNSDLPDLTFGNIPFSPDSAAEIESFHVFSYWCCEIIFINFWQISNGIKPSKFTNWQSSKTNVSFCSAAPSNLVKILSRIKFVFFSAMKDKQWLASRQTSRESEFVAYSKMSNVIVFKPSSDIKFPLAQAATADIDNSLVWKKKNKHFLFDQLTRSVPGSTIFRSRTTLQLTVKLLYTIDAVY